MKRVLALLLLSFPMVVAQEQPRPQLMRPQTDTDARQITSGTTVALPAGTHVLLVLRNALSSKTAKPGDAVYLQTSFPVMQSGRVAIPSGTYVQGVIDHAKRSGMINGRAEVQMHFTHLIYPNGYVVNMISMPGASDSSDAQRVEGEEGTIRAEGTKGRDAAVALMTTTAGAATGGMLGGVLSSSVNGLRAGAGAGAAIGLLGSILMRGNEVRFEPGSTVDMVLQRPIQIDMSQVSADPSQAPQQPQRAIVQRPQPQNALPFPPGFPRN
jgi:type IV secretion system protein VirB10